MSESKPFKMCPIRHPGFGPQRFFCHHDPRLSVDDSARNCTPNPSPIRARELFVRLLFEGVGCFPDGLNPSRLLVWDVVFARRGNTSGFLIYLVSCLMAAPSCRAYAVARLATKAANTY